jgi:hypothetical protein
LSGEGVFYIHAAVPTVDLTWYFSCAVFSCGAQMNAGGVLGLASGGAFGGDFSLTITGMPVNRRIPYIVNVSGFTESDRYGYMGYDLSFPSIRDHESGEDVADAALLFTPEPTTASLCLLCLCVFGVREFKKRLG